MSLWNYINMEQRQKDSKEKKPSVATLSIINLTRINLGTNRDPRHEKPVINRVTYSMV